MTAKEYLEEIRKLQTAVVQHKEEKAFLEKLLYTGEGTEDHIQKLLKEVNAEICDELFKIRERINQISGLGNPVYSELLYQKYILQESMPQIADTLNYSQRSIFNLSAQALEAFTTAYKDVLQTG